MHYQTSSAKWSQPHQLQQKQQSNQTISMALLEELFYSEKYQKTRQIITTLIPSQASHNICALKDSDLKRALKRLICAYNAQLVPSKTDYVEEIYPPEAVMKKFIVEQISAMDTFVDFCALWEMKQLYKQIMDQMSEYDVRNIEQDDYIDMHPFYVKTGYEQYYNPSPDFVELLSQVKERDCALAVLLTEENGSEMYISLVQKEAIKVNIQLIKEQQLNSGASTNNLNYMFFGQRSNNMDKMEPEKRSYSEMMETSQGADFLEDDAEPKTRHRNNNGIFGIGNEANK